MAVLGNLGGDIASRRQLSTAELQLMIDTVTQAEKGIKSIYIIDDKDRTIAAGLPRAERSLRDSQLGIDFSGRSFVSSARLKHRKVWSDTYGNAEQVPDIVNDSFVMLSDR